MRVLRRPVFGALLLVCVIVCVWACPASAQAEPPIGVRAAGMGGAFTAVADDASAVVWNPAGLASGSFFSAAVDRNALDRAESGLFVGLAGPPVGLAYYRTATEALPNGRNSLVAHHAGVSLVQSIGDRGVAAGATLKVVHGTTGAGDSANRFDLDIGVMKAGALGRVGVAVRNLLAPAFGAGNDRVRLERRIRTGVSLSITDSVRIAADADVTKATTPRSRWRDAALGVEDALSSKVWIRAGVHWNTASAGQAGGANGTGAAPIASIGGSYALRGSLLADVQASVGSANGERGWGVGLRFVY